jgi:hypothetical protein
VVEGDVGIDERFRVVVRAETWAEELDLTVARVAERELEPAIFDELSTQLGAGMVATRNGPAP